MAQMVTEAATQPVMRTPPPAIMPLLAGIMVARRVMLWVGRPLSACLAAVAREMRTGLKVMTMAARRTVVIGMVATSPVGMMLVLATGMVAVSPIGMMTALGTRMVAAVAVRNPVAANVTTVTLAAESSITA